MWHIWLWKAFSMKSMRVGKPGVAGHASSESEQLVPGRKETFSHWPEGRRVLRAALGQQGRGRKIK